MWWEKLLIDQHVETDEAQARYCTIIIWTFCEVHFAYLIKGINMRVDYCKDDVLSRGLYTIQRLVRQCCKEIISFLIKHTFQIRPYFCIRYLEKNAPF